MLTKYLWGVALLVYAQLPSLRELEDAGLVLSVRQRIEIDSLLTHYRKKLFHPTCSQERFYWVADSLSEEFTYNLQRILTREQWTHYLKEWERMRSIKISPDR
ncbi:MAG: hypothetical protein ACUVRD_07015 [Bacteroidia bacterium]